MKKEVSQKIIFTLTCDNAAFEDDMISAVQAAFAEAATMAAVLIGNDRTLAFVRDVNGNQCGRIDIVIE